jgi:hypothetical protein
MGYKGNIYRPFKIGFALSGEFLFFARPKKRNEKKRRPVRWSRCDCPRSASLGGTGSTSRPGSYDPEMVIHDHFYQSPQHPSASSNGTRRAKQRRSSSCHGHNEDLQAWGVRCFFQNLTKQDVE